MAIGMDIKAFVRKYKRQPDHLYNHETKPHRKISNRKWRKLSNRLVRCEDDPMLPPMPKTGGRLSV